MESEEKMRKGEIKKEGGRRRNMKRKREGESERDVSV
jgi:hypothetical protein